ncbi:hypothetical protein D1872_235090 [compost metagenome]
MNRDKKICCQIIRDFYTILQRHRNIRRSCKDKINRWILLEQRLNFKGHTQSKILLLFLSYPNGSRLTPTMACIDDNKLSASISLLLQINKHLTLTGIGYRIKAILIQNHYYANS